MATAYTDHNPILNPSIAPDAASLLNAITAHNESLYGSAEEATQDSSYNPYKINAKSEQEQQAQKQASIAQWLAPIPTNTPDKDYEYTDEKHDKLIEEMHKTKLFKKLEPQITEFHQASQALFKSGKIGGQQLADITRDFAKHLFQQVDDHWKDHPNNHTHTLFDDDYENATISNYAKKNKGVR